MRQTDGLILASGSPRRRELLELCGISFECIAPEVDEHCEGKPDECVKMLAKRKAEATHRLHPDRIVLAADTLVYMKGTILGKPETHAEAERMLKWLSGDVHTVYTGVCVMGEGKVLLDYAETEVRFSPLEDAVIHEYVCSGEPMDKAGAYGIQGRAGMFVESITGSYSNVVGLPMALVRRLLKQLSPYTNL